MASTTETFALALTGLILGLAIMVLIILVKEWTQHKARQFWPKLPSAERAYGAMDVEAGQGTAFAIEDLTDRLRLLEASFNMKDHLVEYHDETPRGSTLISSSTPTCSTSVLS
ncbi:Zinc finger RING-type [Penicillium brevicompactum]|uniref:Zinc finger RING-type n=1 Tax=Penicillium brevicompactum TaxID=5074 RepID=A0A9W9U973_PENBR|nr:Zinc finger RING-type [Penicillium brevicompactum]